MEFFGEQLKAQKILSYNLSEVSIRRLSLVMQEHLFGPGEVIFKEGDISDKLFIVIKGTVEVSINIGGSSKKIITQVV